MMQTKALRNNKSFLRNKANLFVIKILSVYLLWKGFHYLATKPDFFLYPYWQKLIVWLGTFYAGITGSVLNVIGEQNISSGIRITYLTSGKYILVEDHCLAIPAMVVFTGSILLFTGSWKDKLWFIPLGLFGIFLINVARLVFVCMAWEHLTAEFYEINHSFIYLVITYGLIALMIMWWMRRFDNTNKVTHSKAS